MKRINLILCLSLMLCGFTKAVDNKEKPVASAVDSSHEVITFKIKKMGLNVGQATLSFQGLQPWEGEEYLLMVFTTRALNFYDEEKIYFDPKTFYPIIIKRDLDLWGKKESITEYYDTDKGEVKIVKLADGEKSEQVIVKQGRLDNIYCFIYRYRKQGAFQMGDQLQLNLPTADVRITLKERTSLNIAGENFDCFFMESDTKKYRIWFAAQDPQIPVRIDGAVGFGKTSLVLEAYIPGAKE